MIRLFSMYLICCLITLNPVFGKEKATKEKSLPLIIHYNGQNNTPLIFHITGDGGAVKFDLKMFKEYKNNGFSFIGLNAFKYFSDKKNPEKVANDLVPIIEKYAEYWNKDSLVLVGFSFGAEVIPFLYDRLSADLKQQSKLVVLLTPAKTSDFHIRFRDMIGLDKKNERYSVVDETAKIKSDRVLAIYGKKEKPSLSENPEQPNLKVLTIKGGHGFKNSREVFRMIKDELD